MRPLLLALILASSLYLCWGFHDPDLGWHLRTGQLIQESGIPHADPFSFTRYGTEWIVPEWLTEYFMWGVFSRFGLWGLASSFAIVITLAFVFLYLRMQPLGVRGAFALILGLAAAAPALGVRAQMVSFLFTAITLFILYLYEHGNSRVVWLLVPLTVLWVNLHPAFALGLAFIGLSAVGLVVDGKSDRAKTLMLVLVACGLVVVVNPYGTKMYSYPLHTVTSNAARTLQEWQTPDFHDPNLLPLLVLIILTFGSLALSKAKASDVLKLSVVTFLVLSSARHVHSFVLVAVPLLAAHAPVFIKGKSLTAVRQLAPAMFLALAVIFIDLSVQAARSIDFRVDENQPIDVVHFIQANGIPQPMYNDYNFGGYLIWHLYPQYKVFIDGRSDMYGNELFNLSGGMKYGRVDPFPVFDHYGIQSAIVAPGTVLCTLLSHNDHWQKVFADDTAEVFIRKP